MCGRIAVLIGSMVTMLPAQAFIARLLGLQVGVDAARGPEEWAFYIQMGDGWSL